MDYLNSHKLFSEGDPLTILNLLKQLKTAYKSKISIDLNGSTNSIKHNELINKEAYEKAKIGKPKNLIELNQRNTGKICKVNGKDHSKSPFAPLTKETREKLLIEKSMIFT